VDNEVGIDCNAEELEDEEDDNEEEEEEEEEETVAAIAGTLLPVALRLRLMTDVGGELGANEHTGATILRASTGESSRR
jgi:hypothetical protein